MDGKKLKKKKQCKMKWIPQLIMVIETLKHKHLYKTLYHFNTYFNIFMLPKNNYGKFKLFYLGYFIITFFCLEFFEEYQIIINNNNTSC